MTKPLPLSIMVNIPVDIYSQGYCSNLKYKLHSFSASASHASIHRIGKKIIKFWWKSERPLQDVALASVSMRPIPLAPIMEKLLLTAENYGSVCRYFIQMLDDRVLSSDIQEKLVRENPPRQVFKLKGSDHCPFFSKPQSLCKILLEIVQLI